MFVAHGTSVSSRGKLAPFGDMAERREQRQPTRHCTACRRKTRNCVTSRDRRSGSAKTNWQKASVWCRPVSYGLQTLRDEDFAYVKIE